MKGVSKNDLFVGIFVILVVGAVVATLIATSGWGVRHRLLVVKTDDASDLRVDTKLYLQGLEIGKITRINPKPGTGGALEFQIEAQILALFPDGTPLRLHRGTSAELEKNVLGGSTLNLLQGTSPLELAAGEVILLHRRTPAVEAFSNLASGLKDRIANTLEATQRALESVHHLADSLTNATGQARRFVAGIQPGTERTLNEAAASMQRMRQLLDTTDTRSGITLAQLNATLEQSRKLMTSTDSLTRLLYAMGGENRPAIREVLTNATLLSQQTTFLMEALSRRPMRVMSGVDLPDSLTAEGRARRALADSVARRQRAESSRTRTDTTRSPQQP